MSRRLVDATDCVKDLQFIRGANKNAYWQMACDYLINKVDAMHTVDAVEVVRCFDCEYGFDWDRDEPYDEVYCAGYCNLREADEVIVQVYSCDYCSYGERKIDG